MGRGLDGSIDPLVLMPLLAGCVVLKARGRCALARSGGFGVGETPLPIPNREVKPYSADGTWLARAWESRSPPVYLDSRPPGRLSSFRRRPARRSVEFG